MPEKKIIAQVFRIRPGFGGYQVKSQKVSVSKWSLHGLHAHGFLTDVHCTCAGSILHLSLAGYIDLPFCVRNGTKTEGPPAQPSVQALPLRGGARALLSARQPHNPGRRAQRHYGCDGNTSPAAPGTSRICGPSSDAQCCGPPSGARRCRWAGGPQHSTSLQWPGLGCPSCPTSQYPRRGSLGKTPARVVRYGRCAGTRAIAERAAVPAPR